MKTLIGTGCRTMAALAALACADSAFALEVTVEAGAGDRTITREEASALVASGEELVKRGGGRFIIDKSLAGYKGDIRIEKGYLRATTSSALGDADKGSVSVFDGATLEFGSDTEALTFGQRPISVSGNGVDGVGALCHVGTGKDQWYAVFENVTLTGATRFGGISYQGSSAGNFRRWDIRRGQLDMGGNDLEITCGFGLCGLRVVNPGTITVKNLGVSPAFYLEGQDVHMGGAATNILTVGENCTLSSQRFAPALAWHVVLDGCIVKEQNEPSNGTAETAAARIDGPVTITERGARFEGGDNKNWSFGGEVDVRGPVSCGSTGFRLHVLQDGDDPTGARMAVAEALVAKSTSAALRILLSPLTGNRETPAVSGADWNGGWRRLSVGGTGALALTGNQANVKYYQREGSVKVTGAEKTHTFSDVLVTGNSTLEWTSAGQVDFGTNRFDVGAAYPAIARLRIADTLVTTNNWPAKRIDKNDGAIRIGVARDATKESVNIPAWGGRRGVLEIGDGACVTGLVHIGVVNDPNETKRTHHGSLIQRGGDLTLFSTAQYAYNFIGNGGSGYMETAGGSLTLPSHFYTGAGKYGRGVWYVKGGSVLSMNTPPIFGQYSSLDNSSKAVFYQTGGVFDSWQGLVSGKTLYDGGNKGNEDVITFAGGTAKLDNGLDLAGAPNAKTILNLRSGGSLEAYWVQLVTNELQTIVGKGEDKPIDGNRAWVNLDGGVLKYRHGKKNANYAAYKAESFFFGDPERLTVTAYAGGAKFDTSGFTVNLNHSIEAPVGRGLKALAWPEGASFADGAWVGAPMVEIDGDGSGASAVAEFDSVNNRVTGFTVTSPGADYTTLTARLTRGGYTNDVPLAVTLTDEKQASGGLTKLGAGTLVLNVANTYGGATRVEGGTLKAVHANAIPAGSAIEAAGGTIDFGGFARDFGAVSVSAGAIENVTGTMDSLVKTGDGAFLLNASVTVAGLIDVQGGTFQLPAARPGFVWGSRVFATNETSTELDTRVALTNGGYDLEPSKAYEPCKAGGYFQPRHYVSYAGYIRNRGTEDCTWTFAFAFDDDLRVIVDGVALAKEGPAEWGQLRRASVTLTPGTHSLLIQLYNGSGQGGASRSDVVGIAYDPQGRNSEDARVYVPLKDPGDGSLVTVRAYDGSTLPTFGALRLAPGTALDLLDGIYTLTRELRLTADAAKPVSVKGRLVFGEGAAVSVENLGELAADEGEAYVLATATEGFGGTLPALADGRWRLRVRDDGKTLVLHVRRGLVLTIR